MSRFIETIELENKVLKEYLDQDSEED
jgi:hypothetical protein